MHFNQNMPQTSLLIKTLTNNLHPQTSILKLFLLSCFLKRTLSWRNLNHYFLQRVNNYFPKQTKQDTSRMFIPLTIVLLVTRVSRSSFTLQAIIRLSVVYEKIVVINSGLERRILRLVATKNLFLRRHFVISSVYMYRNFPKET